MTPPYTSAEYVQELVEDLISAGVDYGDNPTEANETALSFAAEQLYRALEIIPNDSNQVPNKRRHS